MQVGILHGKVEPDHPERHPARQDANSGRGGVKCVSVPEEPYEGNPHVRFCEGGSRSYGLYPSTRPASKNSKAVREETLVLPGKSIAVYIRSCSKTQCIQQYVRRYSNLHNKTTWGIYLKIYNIFTHTKNY